MGCQRLASESGGRSRGKPPPSPARPCPAEHVVALMPEAGSPLHARVLQYRELLDALPMDAYTHGCILHPELTTDSMIPKYATAEIRSESRVAAARSRTPFVVHLLPFKRSPPSSPSSRSGSLTLPLPVSPSLPLPVSASLYPFLSLSPHLGASGSLFLPLCISLFLSLPPACFLSTSLSGPPSRSPRLELCLSPSGSLCLSPSPDPILVLTARAEACLVCGELGTSTQESKPRTPGVGAQGGQGSGWQSRALSDIRVCVTKEGHQEMVRPPRGVSDF